MNRKSWITFSMVLCLVGVAADGAFAFGSFRDSFQAAYPNACQPLVDASTSAQSCVLCHGGGFSLNPYGAAVDGAGGDYASIEALDSDGDGRTNGEEINEDCTLPGDVASPEALDSWGAVKVLFR